MLLQVINILDMIYFFDQVKSNFILQLIKATLSDLQKLLKNFNITATSVSNLLLLLSGVFLYLLTFVTQKIYWLLPYCCLPYNHHDNYFH